MTFNFDDDEDDEEFDSSGETNFTCVGNHFRETEEKVAFHALEEGDMVILVPEPENPYDDKAIKIVQISEEGAAIHLGYVPRTENEELAEKVESLGGFTRVHGTHLIGNVFVLRTGNAPVATLASS